MYIVERKRKNEEISLRVFKATPNKNSIPFHNIFKKNEKTFEEFIDYVFIVLDCECESKREGVLVQAKTRREM